MLTFCSGFKTTRWITSPMRTSSTATWNRVPCRPSRTSTPSVAPSTRCTQPAPWHLVNKWSSTCMMLSVVPSTGTTRKSSSWIEEFPPWPILTVLFSLLIINFDEHGGFADHVPTPLNVPQPEDNITFTGTSEGHEVSYDFTRLGVR